MALDVGSLSVLSIGGSSFIDDLSRAVVEITDDTQRVDAITRSSQAVGSVKRSAHFEVDLFSTTTLPDRVTHLHLSAFTIGGTDYSGNLERVSVEVSYETKQKPQAGALWKTPQNVTKKLRSTVVMAVANTGGIPLLVSQLSATLANQNVALSLTLNAVIVTIAMRVVKVSAPWEQDGLQMYTVELEGRDPGAGAFPAAPTGTTTLLEKALNDFKTALTFEFESHATEGFELTGNMIFSGLNFEIADGELVVMKYSFDSTGTVAGAAT